MTIIAIDTSGLVASVAIVRDDIVAAEYSVQYRKTHSQTLVPMLDEIKRMTELDLADVTAIAVAGGPGSFTGLRIGSATAKALGFTLEIPLVEIPTLEGLAYNLYGSDKLICPLMDARRDQVYTAAYEFVPPAFTLSTVVAPAAVAIDEIAATLNKIGREVILTGDGVPIYADRLAAILEIPYSFAPPHMNRQRAAALAALARIYLAEGKTTSAADHAPEYLRVSQAERLSAPTIRPMTEADIEVVSAIEGRVFSMPWSAADFHAMLEAPYAHYYVAEVGAKTVGAAGLHCVVGDGQITNLFVDLPYRRRGIARLLLERMIAEQAAETEIFSLEVRASNTAAISLYESLGFEICGRRPGFYEKPREDALIYRLSPN